MSATLRPAPVSLSEAIPPRRRQRPTLGRQGQAAGKEHLAPSRPPSRLRFGGVNRAVAVRHRHMLAESVPPRYESPGMSSELRHSRHVGVEQVEIAGPRPLRCWVWVTTLRPTPPARRGLGPAPSRSCGPPQRTGPAAARRRRLFRPPGFVQDDPPGSPGSPGPPSPRRRRPHHADGHREHLRVVSPQSRSGSPECRRPSRSAPAPEASDAIRGDPLPVILPSAGACADLRFCTCVRPSRCTGSGALHLVCLLGKHLTAKPNTGTG
jgi:hypothetical protein